MTPCQYNSLVKLGRGANPGDVQSRIRCVTASRTTRKDNMPPQTHVDQPRQAQPGSDAEPGTTAPTAPLSRRSVLRGAAGAGAVGFAAAAGAGAVFAATRPSTGTRPAEADAGKVVTTDTAPQKPAGEPLVV